MAAVEPEVDIAHRMDVHEDVEKNLITATFELPGLAKENVHIDVKDNVLSISGESTVSNERDEKGYSVRERRFGKFSRSLPLPQGVKVGSALFGERPNAKVNMSLQPEEIKASMTDGVLTVTFPRTTPDQVPHKISIQ